VYFLSFPFQHGSSSSSAPSSSAFSPDSSHLNVNSKPQEGDFIVLDLDYSFLGQLQLRDELSGGYFAPRCKLKMDRQTGEILPLEIDLGEIKCAPERGWKWRYFKLAFQCAEFTHHELVSHLGQCHLVTEVFIMETMRSLKEPNHEIYKLLLPHFSRTLAVNRGARELLLPWLTKHLSVLSPESIRELIASTVREFPCENLDFVHSLTKRGFDPQALPPNYHYAKDGLAIWNALVEFVGSILSSSVDLKWRQINAWSAAIQARIPSFPSFANQNLTLLTSTVAGIIFNASVQHSAVNDPQYYFFGYPPNAVCRLAKQIPTDRGSKRWTDENWKQHYFQSLPFVEVMQLQKDLVKLLALGAAPQSSLYTALEDYTRVWSPNQIAGFKAKLECLSAVIQERADYPWLDPLSLSRSVSR